MTKPRYTHLDEQGRARMVDVSEKAPTRRTARARGRLRVGAPTVAAFEGGLLAKGDAAALARVAGIQGAKQTAAWIPLCHPLRLDRVEVRVEAEGETHLSVEADVTAVDRTGVEMEAMTAVSAALLTLYDMVKALDRGAVIEDVQLLEKRGGRSGTWTREGA